jgi:hypothetical protein
MTSAITTENDMSKSAHEAAERILAAAAEIGVTRQEAVLVTRAVHAIKKGRSTDVALTDTEQHRRRKLAHIVGTEMWHPYLDPDAILAAVAGTNPPAGRELRSPARLAQPLGPRLIDAKSRSPRRVPPASPGGRQSVLSRRPATV